MHSYFIKSGFLFSIQHILGLSIEESSIIIGFFGSVLGILGSIIVAYIYISNQNKSEKNKRIYEQIQETYIEQGILSLEESIQEYATNTIFAILDYVTFLNRYYINTRDEKQLLLNLDKIKQRPIINKLLNRQLDTSIDSFPYVRRFGNVIYGNTMIVFQHWSELLISLMAWDNMKIQLTTNDPKEISRSILSIGNLIQESQIYLLDRLENLKDYILEKEYNSYSEFLQIIDTVEYKIFINEMEYFNKMYKKMMDNMLKEEGGGRIESSKEFNEFMSKRVKNPFKK